MLANGPRTQKIVESRDWIDAPFVRFTTAIVTDRIDIANGVLCWFFSHWNHLTSGTKPKENCYKLSRDGGDVGSPHPICACSALTSTASISNY